jgi:hypothetical protein
LGEVVYDFTWSRNRDGPLKMLANYRGYLQVDAAPAYDDVFGAPRKGAGPQRVEVPPGSWFVPPGNNRSSGEGNEAAEAFGEEGRMATR